ncbi:MAG: hypothetical protein GQ574_11745 [Crocinitomix sp.]|nr:hypothetical protein [Crocinitomix sp.]
MRFRSIHILILIFVFSQGAIAQRNEIGLTPFKIQKDVYSDTAFKAKFMSGLYYKWNSDIFSYSGLFEHGRNILRENCLVCADATSAENRTFILKELNAKFRFGIKKDFGSISLGVDIGTFFSSIRREYSYLSASSQLSTSAIRARVYGGELNIWAGFQFFEKFSVQLETSFLLGNAKNIQLSSKFFNTFEQITTTEFNSRYSSWILPSIKISYLF